VFGKWKKDPGRGTRKYWGSRLLSKVLMENQSLTDTSSGRTTDSEIDKNNLGRRETQRSGSSYFVQTGRPGFPRSLHQWCGFQVEKMKDRKNYGKEKHLILREKKKNPGLFSNRAHKREIIVHKDDFLRY